jgi:hypothetical protein
LFVWRRHIRRNRSVLGLADIAGNAFIALAPTPTATDRRTGADLFQSAFDLEIIGEVEGGARTVGAAHDGDGVGGGFTSD